MHGRLVQGCAGLWAEGVGHVVYPRVEKWGNECSLQHKCVADKCMGALCRGAPAFRPKGIGRLVYPHEGIAAVSTRCVPRQVDASEGGEGELAARAQEVCLKQLYAFS